ncbi:xylose repressor [Paenibacillus baekrokdamisoli]|uniref:Xylose repressor n=1 Tax=Paenibacillus baekrokdamisoli TaxID=1712516 RepID=A0A3G9IZ02_9BACL|nr:ROK family protein [Paenibacillus baekrokdamisoli]MBB3069174.1 putative NBD/HSP70 family sugar kinase [Paenibacillus baekrokdamisoli]BBH18851.1 xylose repressor [Paenibacillus baekrokdamisoli]
MSAPKTKQGTNLEDVQEMNRSLVIRLIRKRQVCSRAELAQASGLNQSTITNIINEFLSWGLVVETGMIDGKKGRRSIGIQLNSELYKIIGIKLAHKSISAGLYDLAGNEYSHQQITIANRDSAATAFKNMKKLITEMIQLQAGRVIAIGIATPDPLFRNEDRMDRIRPWWETMNIQENVRNEFGIPVYIEHDAKAAALAHWWFDGPRLDQGVLIYAAAGQGVRAGIVIDGKVFRGSLGMAGEMGHMSIDYKGPDCECGHKGCLELYCSTSALLKMLNKDHATLKSVWKDLKDRDSLTEEAVHKVAWFLGFGLVNLVNLYNPDCIILGGELSAAGDPFVDTVKRVIMEHVRSDVSSELTISLSALEQDDILIGAATIAMDSLLEQPSSYFAFSKTE